MTFPQTPLPVIVELFIDAAWTDITSHVYVRDDITISRGRANEQGQAEASTLNLTVDNRDGRYSPRNPTGIYYGKIGRNTQIRVRVTGETDARFVGEVVAWPQQWDKSETDIYVPLEAAGIMRRLGQGGNVPKSAPRRYIPTTSPVAYWPLEEGSAAKQGEPLVGAYPMRSINGQLPAKFGEGELGDWLPNGVKGASATTNSRLVGTVGGGINDDNWAVDVVFREMDAQTGTILIVTDAGAGEVGDPQYMWTLTMFGEATNNVLQLEITDDDGTPVTTLLDTSDPLEALGDEQTHHLRLSVEQSGTSVAWAVWVDGAGVLVGSRVTTTNHGPARVEVRTWGAFGTETAYGHVAVWSQNTTLPQAVDIAQVALGSIGETAGRRIERLCDEEGVTFTGMGDLDESQGMGAQGVDGFLNLIRECEAADLGLLNESRTALGLVYCTRESLYNQTAALTLDYSTKVFASVPEPVDDDQLTRNQVTVSRAGGSSYTADLATGALSTLAPPSGVGTYDESVTLSLAGDGIMLANQAGWRVHLGTVDAARYPMLHLNLAAPAIASNSSLTTAIVNLDICDRLDLSDLPSWIPPDDVTLLVMGFMERIGGGGFIRDITVNCVPESPYRVAEYESAVSATGWKYGTEGATLSAGIDSDDTSLSVATAAGSPLWTADNAEDGFDILIGGERLTVTDISGAASPQTFTCTRSVNGVVKSHSSGAALRLWKRPVYGL